MEGGGGERLLEYSKSGRASCKGKCKESLEKGQLRFGTRTEIDGRTAYQFRCLGCITKQQAKNLLDGGLDSGFLAFGEGVEEDLQALFKKYIIALGNGEDEAKTLLEQLVQKKLEEEASESKTKKQKTLRPIQEIFEQGQADGFDSLRLDELKALVKKAKLPVTGNKTTLTERLNAFLEDNEFPKN